VLVEEYSTVGFVCASVVTGPGIAASDSALSGVRRSLTRRGKSSTRIQALYSSNQVEPKPAAFTQLEAGSATKPGLVVCTSVQVPVA
jgi:hypothetical protein